MTAPAPFSVLMSLYAGEQADFLEACFRSIEEQDVQPAEIVVVRDGPLTAALETVLARFAVRLPLKAVDLPENGGLGPALNAGLEHCTYEWVLRMDSDDVCAPGRFAAQWDYTSRHPATDFFGGQISEFTTDPLHCHARKTVPETQEDIMRTAIGRNPFNHMTMAFKKATVLAVGGYRAHAWMEDYHLWLRLLAAGYRCCNLADTLVYARAGRAMHARRRGLPYIRSEYALYRLKRELGFSTPVPAFLYFLLRAGIRILPVSVLSGVYRRMLRQAVHP